MADSQSKSADACYIGSGTRTSGECMRVSLVGVSQPCLCNPEARPVGEAAAAGQLLVKCQDVDTSEFGAKRKHLLCSPSHRNTYGNQQLLIVCAHYDGAIIAEGRSVEAE